MSYCATGIPLKEDLLYRGVRSTWFGSDYTVDDCIEEIIKEQVGESYRQQITKDELRTRLTEPLTKMLGSKLAVEQEYQNSVISTSKPFECGRAIGITLKPHMKSFIPNELVGKTNKFKIICAIEKTFLCGKEDLVPLKLFRSGLILKGNEVKWTKGLSVTVKLTLIMKVVKWLFRVAKRLVASKYYVTERQGSPYRLYYFPKKLWQSKTDKALNLLISSGVLRQLTADEAQPFIQRRQHATLRWLPKQHDLRPVISVRNDKKNYKTMMAKTFLNTLLMNTSSVVNALSLHKVWLELLNGHSFGEKIYFVALDFSDAYGSIIQEKLIEILKEEVTSHLGGTDFDNTHVTMVKGTRRNGKEVTACLEMLKFPIFDFTVLKVLKVSDLINYITTAVTCQTVKKMKNYFLMSRGISQAMSLSPALCSLYISHLVQKKLQYFTSDADDKLIRAVDDFLYITHDKSRAKLFLETMADGFDEYGLKVNDSKTQTNLDYDLEVEFFGNLYNSGNLEVYVKYSQGANLPFRNSMSFKSCSYEILEDKLKRIPTYKLTCLTIDPTYMRIEGVARNIFETACLMACSFKTIVDLFPGKDCPDISSLIELIERCAKGVAQRIFRLTVLCSKTNHPSLHMKLKKKEVCWIVYRAFVLCLSHNPRHNNVFPGNLLPKLYKLEEASQTESRPVVVKLIYKVVKSLPLQFSFGY